MSEADEVEQELATLAAHVDAATHRLLVLVRRFDELGNWATQGARSCAHWLSWRVGLGPGAAREQVRVARALAGLPRIDDALRLGKLSYAKVRAMTRVATSANEETLLEMALYATAAQIERICRGVRSVRAADTRRAHDERGVAMRQLDSGLVRVTLDLHADEAALVMRAIEEARHVPAGTSLRDRADAVVAVAETSLAGATRTASVSDGAAKSDGARTTVRARRRSGATRSEVVITLAPDVLADGFRAELDDGTTVPAETFRRVACDCALTAVVRDANGTVLTAGRRTRVVSASLERALRRRDPCCRFPSCTNRAWLDSHHVKHWAHSGDTTLANLLRLCPAHHKLVHEGGASVSLDDHGAPTFRNSGGFVIDNAPRPPRLPPAPIEALYEDQADLDIDDNTGFTKWDGRRPDYGLCVEAAMRD